jgi:hypothetical protein
MSEADDFIAQLLSWDGSDALPAKWADEHEQDVLSEAQNMPLGMGGPVSSAASLSAFSSNSQAPTMTQPGWAPRECSHLPVTPPPSRSISSGGS